MAAGKFVKANLFCRDEMGEGEGEGEEGPQEEVEI